MDIVFRPQHVRIDFDRAGRGPNPTASQGVAARALVKRARFLGSYSLIEFRLETDGARISATVPSVFLPKAGQAMWLTVPRDRYGNDMDNGDNPYECGFDKYINIDSDVIFLGKEKLKTIKSEGINKKLMGVKFDIEKISLTGSLDLTDDQNNIVGELRSACYSPHFKKVIGIAMMKKSHWNVDQKVKASINSDICSGKVCDLPFI